MKARTIKEAWEEANKIFPYDYQKDEFSSENAGYPIYRSTALDHPDNWISDLGTRLEVNTEDGKTVTIWIEEEPNKSPGEGENKMKLHEFLAVMDKDTFVTISISVCDIQFEARHRVEFFFDNGAELINKKIIKACTVNGELHIRLED